MPSQQMLVTKQLLAAGANTTTTTGTALDMQGSINPGGRNIKVFINVPTVTGTTPSVTFTVMTGSNTTVASMSSAYTFAAITTNQSQNVEAHIQTNNRYIAIVETLTANTTSVTAYAGCLLENRIT